jgi:phosphatidylglycerophosphatase A
MGKWEIIFIAATLLVIIGSMGFTRRGPRETNSRIPDQFKLWIAQGFGVGRVPLAPGTLGSVIGVLWFVLLLLPGSIWVFAAGTIAGVAVAIWLAGAAERTLRAKDPASVVLDEIVAVPICFSSWLGVLFFKTGALPAPEYFFAAQHWKLTLLVFVAFRVLDIAKPWPVRQSQNLSGGWGVTVDDVLAALYVAALVLLVYAIKPFELP